MPKATQIADWIVHFRHDELAVPVDPMSLEKLAYYAQSFWLALTGDPLFQDEVRAWVYGPVIPSIFNAYRDFKKSPIVPREGTAPPIVDSAIEDFLTDLVTFFGIYTAIQLSNASHAEEPWRKARVGFGRREPSDVAIPAESLRSYYCQLFYDGEHALSRHELLSAAREPRWSAYYVAGIATRRLLSHPLYQPELGRKFLEPVPEIEGLEDDFYAPIGVPEFVEVTGDELERSHGDRQNR